MRLLAVACLVLIPPAGLNGQSAPRAFDVASIKPHTGRMPSMGIATSGARLTAEATTVQGLIMYAFNLKNYQVADMPSGSLVGDTFYDVVAAVDGEVPTTAEFRRMLQGLLAERFSLKAHHEVKEMPVYALVVAKGGPKFRESVPDAAPVSNHGAHGKNQTMTLVKTTMASVADHLWGSFGLDRPVVDKTGLSGTYDIKFDATPESAIGRGAGDADDLGVFTALQEQLGLKLEAQKAPMEILVVDHIARPSGN